MGTLWLGGVEGLIAQNFTQITGADTGFPEGGDFTSTPPPPWTLSAWRHSPSGKLKNTPLPPLLLPKKRTAAAQKTELPKSWGAAAPPPPAPPPPPASYAYVYRPRPLWVLLPERWKGELIKALVNVVSWTEPCLGRPSTGFLLNYKGHLAVVNCNLFDLLSRRYRQLIS